MSGAILDFIYLRVAGSYGQLDLSKNIISDRLCGMNCFLEHLPIKVMENPDSVFLQHRD